MNWESLIAVNSQEEIIMKPKKEILQIMILDAIVALKDDNAFMYCNDLLQFSKNQERNRDFYVM